MPLCPPILQVTKLRLREQGNIGMRARSEQLDWGLDSVPPPSPGRRHRTHHGKKQERAADVGMFIICRTSVPRIPTLSSSPQGLPRNGTSHNQFPHCLMSN